MQNEIFQQDPRKFEDWEDIIFWKEAFDNVFYETTRKYFENLIVKIPDNYWVDCVNNKELSEISEIVNLYKKESFVDDSYEVCALFVDNKKKERFFILKKNNEYYGLDISKEYKYLCRY